ncbi:unnamed protein product [Arctia plantaginis]|uniref:Reverse transcriptase domain-containing protein n=1 Tax=Arctia plantaginis TaxID=874455 RepID=A0A8S1A793_ARCPL|nr:unnamed protein product [Arctia plantaginis]
MEPDSPNTADLRASPIDPMDTEHIPSILEFDLSRMKCVKASGKDEVYVEMLQVGGLTVVKQLGNLFNKVLSETIIPDTWKNAIVSTPLLKNYRPINLLSQIYKLFARVEQAGFQTDYSTTDPLLTVKELMERCSFDNVPPLCSMTKARCHARWKLL